MRLKVNILYLAIVAFVVLFSSCQSEIGPEDAQHDTFFKKYGGANAEFDMASIKTDDGGYLLFGSAFNENKHLRITKTDKFGRMLSSRLEQTDDDMLPQVSRLRNGSILVNGFFSSDMFVINQDGSVANYDVFDPNAWNSNMHEPPIEGNDGKLYYGYSNGYGSGYSYVYMSILNELGKEVDYFELPPSYWGHKILSMHLIKVDTDNPNGNIYWLSGECFVGLNLNWSDPAKFYIAKIDENFNLTINIFDTNDKNNSFDIDRVISKDGNLVNIKSSGIWWYDRKPTAAPDFQLIKSDLNTNTIWNKKISIVDATFVNPVCMKNTSDGGYLISGYCTTSGQSFTSPFFVKVDANGNEELQRVYNLSGEATFMYGEEHPDGGYYFNGWVSEYGHGKEAADNFLLRTNKIGDYNE